MRSLSWAVPGFVMSVAIIGAVFGSGAPTAAAGQHPPVTHPHAASRNHLAVSQEPAHDAAAKDSLGIRLLDIPAGATADPRAHEYIVDSLLPGTTIQRRIEISNGTAAPLTVAVYSGAAKIARGSFLGAPAGSHNTLSQRTSVSAPQVVVGAHQSVIDTVTVAIPADAAPGESYAEVWAQVADAGGNISLVARVGVRLYLDVRGNNPPETNFTITTMTALRNAEKRPVVKAMVHNTGGRAIDVTGVLTLDSASGSLHAGPYDAELGTTLAPGQSEPVTIVPMDPLGDGPWKAILTLSSGTVQKEVHATITFPQKTGTGSISTAHAGPGGIAPLLWLIGGALILLLIATLMWIVVTRRSRSRSSRLESGAARNARR
jgi:hypothetical protein